MDFRLKRGEERATLVAQEHERDYQREQCCQIDVEVSTRKLAIDVSAQNCKRGHSQKQNVVVSSQRHVAVSQSVDCASGTASWAIKTSQRSNRARNPKFVR